MAWRHDVAALSPTEPPHATDSQGGYCSASCSCARRLGLRCRGASDGFLIIGTPPGPLRSASVSFTRRSTLDVTRPSTSSCCEQRRKPLAPVGHVVAIVAAVQFALGP